MQRFRLAFATAAMVLASVSFGSSAQAQGFGAGTTSFTGTWANGWYFDFMLADCVPNTVEGRSTVNGLVSPVAVSPGNTSNNAFTGGTNLTPDNLIYSYACSQGGGQNLYICVEIPGAPGSPPFTVTTWDTNGVPTTTPAVGYPYNGVTYWYVNSSTVQHLNTWGADINWATNGTVSVGGTSAVRSARRGRTNVISPPPTAGPPTTTHIRFATQ